MVENVHALTVRAGTWQETTGAGEEVEPYVAGGLISYGPNFVDQYRRAAGYVDRILRGVRPADLHGACEQRWRHLDAERLGNDDKHNGNGVGDFQHQLCGGAATGDKHIRGKRNEFRCMLLYCGLIASAPAHLDPHVAPRRPTRLLKPSRNAVGRALAFGVSADTPSNTPTSRRRSPCCARAASGHAAAPPRRLMNSRRRISAPKVSGQHCIGSNGDVDRAQTGHQNHCRSALSTSAVGQKTALPRRSIDVRFAPNEQTLTERV